jgi:hypothetical protein
MKKMRKTRQMRFFSTIELASGCGHSLAAIPRETRPGAVTNCLTALQGGRGMLCAGLGPRNLEDFAGSVVTPPEYSAQKPRATCAALGR